MAEINQSLRDGVCIDEEVFFGPITDKERKIREHFENAYKSENKITGELPKINENDISRNDSLYVSFSIEDSKYDSFDDSLNEDVDKKPQGAKHSFLRKSLEKLKHKKHGFYDSLEDVCSLASNIEKCSISCEVENEKQPIIDDSLRNLPITINKSCVNEQIHFDDDSLAVVEIENTFDDSLEEFNVLSSIEIEEINDAEIITTEHQNVSSKVEQTPLCTSRNLFETSVQVIYESKKETDLEESSGDKNMLYDSLSNSDLKDSLEDSEKCVDNILRHVSDASIINTQKSEQFTVLPSIKIDEMRDVKPMNSELKIEEKLNCTPKSHFDTSVQIICEKEQETALVDQEESSDDKNALYDSLSNSDFKDILDSLEESEKCIVNLQVSNAPTADTEKLEQISIKSDILDDSVQIVYENLQNLHSEENIRNGVTDSELNILKHTFENLQNSRDLDDQRITKIATENTSLFSSIDATKKLVNDDLNAICLDSNSIQECKVSVDGLQSVSSESEFCTPIKNHNFSKDTFTVDSCHLKLLDDNINVDKNLKFELHIEVTVGDKKCKIAAEDIKLLPITNLDSKISESNPSTLPLVDSESCVIEEKPDLLDSCNSGAEYKKNEFNTHSENILNSNSNENELHQKQETINEANVTRRTKTFSEQINNSDLKLNFCEHTDNVNLLQALDLHDISTSFLNESVIQSNDSVIPLNLCSREQDIKKIKKSLFRNESKENISESLNYYQEKVTDSPSKRNQTKLNCKKTPKNSQKSPSSKETKRTPGTKIPVRKVENFLVPTVASSKLLKQVSSSSSAEKAKKHPCPQTPHSAEKKTPISTPNKTPHFCKVRNTIFSKVPQIVPSKKYINIQSPVAQYIRNTPGSAKTPVLDPVLRDCMNHIHQHMESPYHLYQVPKSGSAKSTKSFSNGLFIVPVQEYGLKMELSKMNISICNMLFAGLIQGPKNLNELLQNIVQKYRRDLWKYQDDTRMLCAPLVDTMMMGNIQDLKVFLMYGFEKMISTRRQITSSFGYILHPMRDSEDDFRGMTLTLSELDSFLENIDRATEKRRRLVIETFIVASMYYYYPPLGVTVFMCFELAWRSTPEPYVKAEEMYEVMTLLCGFRADKGISRVCDFYREKFRENAVGPKEPRTLQHLSRCTLRRKLARSFSLPGSIEELTLPQKLKDYVRLLE